MDNPTQQLLHLTSRGSNVRSKETGLIGQFANLTTQPINNINKFGLLHYSIPKTIDLLSAENRSFNIVVTYQEGPPVTIPAMLPIMDYYNMAVDEIGGALISFAEILQTSINWAIQKDWTAHKVVNAQQPYAGGGAVSNRLGCIVQLTPDGRFQFIFGYRGQKVIQDSTGHNAGAGGFVEKEAAIWGDSTIQINTGAPFPVVGENAEPYRDFPGVEQSVNGEYKWIATDGTPQIHGGFANAGHKTCSLYSVHFTNLSDRLQFLFGSGSSGVASQHEWLQEEWNADLQKRKTDRLYISRGRMLLVNYGSRAGGNPRTGLINLEMELRPNLYPPSFLFIALTIQGTKSKVLGHEAERGGWSVPTSANMFKSQYDNLPKSLDGTYEYSPYDVRQPAAVNNMWIKNRTNVVEGGWLNKGVPAEQFDQLPFGAGAVVYTDAAIGWEVREIDNYALTPGPTLINGNAAGNPYDPDVDHRWGSRLVHFGDLVYMMAQATKRPRSSKQFGLQYGEAPTFTLSMIDPNWIFTDVPNSTLQTLDMKLLWGDTAKPIYDVSPYPVQITLIASQ
jgi:hypothetical protein